MEHLTTIEGITLSSMVLIQLDYTASKLCLTMLMYKNFMDFQLACQLNLSACVSPLFGCIM